MEDIKLTKEFEEPEMEVILFGEDIITTSGGSGTDGGDDGEPDNSTWG